MQDWDPIGVVGVTHANDEYDDYVRSIAEMVVGKASAVTLAAHLMSIETVQMNLAGDADRATRVAAKLAALADR